MKRQQTRSDGVRFGSITAAVFMAGCGTAEPGLGTPSQALQGGEPVVKNTAAAAGHARSDPLEFSASGSLLQPDVFLTAAHTLSPFIPGFIFLEEAGVIFDTANIDLTRRFFHPTYGGPIADTPFSSLGPVSMGASSLDELGLDLAVAYLDRAAQAPSATFPRAIHVDQPQDTIIGRADGVRFFGYGGTQTLTAANGTVDSSWVQILLFKPPPHGARPRSVEPAA